MRISLPGQGKYVLVGLSAVYCPILLHIHLSVGVECEHGFQNVNFGGVAFRGNASFLDFYSIAVVVKMSFPRGFKLKHQKLIKPSIAQSVACKWLT